MMVVQTPRSKTYVVISKVQYTRENVVQGGIIYIAPHWH